MKKLISAALFFGLPASQALAHPSVQEHAHPHTDASSYFTIETLVIFAIGLSIGGTFAWYKRRKGDRK
ncbi:hypothetical protein [Roseibium sp. RKSG952]|uniref:hypothetical protein n=1 Tax=Roseibium sp. RKSG952 TaxID=2529384 RepID=UPI0012BD58C7|nr:hypothetical protein [Roseibium sp. RKSG952]MTI01061.1 hypothetical protein [Roseibium sp. RKSG952]